MFMPPALCVGGFFVGVFGAIQSNYHFNHYPVLIYSDFAGVETVASV